MKFAQIEKMDGPGTDAISDLLKQARADLPMLEAAHKAAEGAQAKAENERMRLEKLRENAQAKCAMSLERIRTSKRRALESHVNETADDAAHGEYVKAKLERNMWLDRLSFLTSFSLETATRACLAADLGEREAYANLLEGQSVAKRLALMNLSAAALAEDPGAEISLQDAEDERGRKSLSVRLANEVKRIRIVDIPNIELYLRDHDRRVAAEQTLVGVQLFA